MADSTDTIALAHMTIGKLRKAVSAMRKKACPPVSRMKKDDLVKQLKAYSAEVSARSKAESGKQFKMMEKAHSADGRGSAAAKPKKETKEEHKIGFKTPKLSPEREAELMKMNEAVKAEAAAARKSMKKSEKKAATEAKEKKGASAWNKFAGEKMKAGMTMKEAAEAWRASKA
jgi:hypothetical protein